MVAKPQLVHFAADNCAYHHEIRRLVFFLFIAFLENKHILPTKGKGMLRKRPKRYLAELLKKHFVKKLSLIENKLKSKMTRKKAMRSKGNCNEAVMALRAIVRRTMRVSTLLNILLAKCSAKYLHDCGKTTMNKRSLVSPF
ncbi:MAG: hypothetical protein EOP33_08645 [Rickettsiaceae bacterium]|nr:MAG: hypothetical protein EOP33_08645 [Rickettsiaceae bacterium]